MATTSEKLLPIIIYKGLSEHIYWFVIVRVGMEEL